MILNNFYEIKMIYNNFFLPLEDHCIDLVVWGVEIKMTSFLYVLGLCGQALVVGGLLPICLCSWGGGHKAWEGVRGGGKIYEDLFYFWLSFDFVINKFS